MKPSTIGSSNPGFFYRMFASLRVLQNGLFTMNKPVCCISISEICYSRKMNMLSAFGFALLVNYVSWAGAVFFLHPYVTPAMKSSTGCFKKHHAEIDKYLMVSKNLMGNMRFVQ